MYISLNIQNHYQSAVKKLNKISHLFYDSNDLGIRLDMDTVWKIQYGPYKKYICSNDTLPKLRNLVYYYITHEE